MKTIGQEHDTTKDREAFDALFRKHYSRLYMYALHITGSDEDSRDIVIDVFTSLWKNMADLHTDSIKAYLNTGVRNRSIDYLRKNILRSQYSDEYLHTAEGFYSDPEEWAEKDRLVETMLSMLQPPTYDVFKLRYLFGMKYAEVAEQLGISPNTVKKHIVKGLKLLKEIYKGKQPFV